MFRTVVLKLNVTTSTKHKIKLIMLNTFKTFVRFVILFFLPVTEGAAVLGLFGLAVTRGTLGFRIDVSCFRSIRLSGN